MHIMHLYKENNASILLYLDFKQTPYKLIPVYILVFLKETCVQTLNQGTAPERAQSEKGNDWDFILSYQHTVDSCRNSRIGSLKKEKKIKCIPKFLLQEVLSGHSDHGLFT